MGSPAPVDSRPRSRQQALFRTPGSGRQRKGWVAFAGGRWRIMLLRGMVYTLLGVLIAGGLRNLIAPRHTDVDTLTEQVREQLGETGFPTRSAEAFAIRFAREYLTYSEASKDTRDQTLALYAPDAAAGRFGFAPERDQAVISGPVVAGKPEMIDRNNAVITIAAQVTGGTWLYLAVPVYADESGAMVVSGPPAFVAPPAQADNPGLPGVGPSDSELADTLIRDVLTGYFTAWARSDSTAVARYTTPDATPEATTGLGGAVTLARITSVKVSRDGGRIREGIVELVWSAEKTGSYSQSYRITVTQADDGRWYVHDLKGGVVTPGSGQATR